MKDRIMLAVFLILIVLCKFSECLDACAGNYKDVLCDYEVVKLDTANAYCMKWYASSNSNNNPCDLKFEDVDGLVVHFKFAAIQGEIKIGEDFSLSDPLVTLQDNSPYLDFTLKTSNSDLYIQWITNNPNATIEARFKIASFVQHELVLLEKKEGNITFFKENYALNSVYVWVLKNSLNVNYLNLTSLEIKISEAFINNENGDALIVGVGNNHTAFAGSKSLLLTRSITEPLNIHVTSGDAFIVLLTGAFTATKPSHFLLIWNRLITDSWSVTEMSTTPLPDAWVQGIPICILTNQSVNNFLKNHSVFREKVAEMASTYAIENKIPIFVSHISSSEVLIKEEYTIGFGKNDSEGIQTLLTIVYRNEKNLPVFRASQLESIFSDSKKLIYLTASGFQIVPCEERYTYWDWFWAACIVFILSTVLLLVVWYIRYKDFFNEKYEEFTDLQSIHKPQISNRYVPEYTGTTKNSLELYTSQDSSNAEMKSEIKTADFQLNVQAHISHDSVPDRIEMMPASVSTIKRNTSAPNQMSKPLHAVTDSPRSILKTRRPMSLRVHLQPVLVHSNEATSDNADEIDNSDEHIYQTPEMVLATRKPDPPQVVVLEEQLNEETYESKL